MCEPRFQCVIYACASPTFYLSFVHSFVGRFLVGARFHFILWFSLHISVLSFSIGRGARPLRPSHWTRVRLWIHNRLQSEINFSFSIDFWTGRLETRSLNHKILDDLRKKTHRPKLIIRSTDLCWQRTTSKWTAPRQMNLHGCIALLSQRVILFVSLRAIDVCIMRFHNFIKLQRHD